MRGLRWSKSCRRAMNQMNRLIKSSFYVTSVGLLGTIFSDINFIVLAKKCGFPDSGSFISCQYSMIGVAALKAYIFLPITLVSFLIVIIPALVYLAKKKPIHDTHIKLIIYSITAVFIACNLAHILISLLF